MPDRPHKLSITAIGAISPAGSTWAETWAGLLAGDVRSVAADRVPLAVPAAAPAAMVANLDRTTDQYGRGPAARLLRGAVLQISGALDGHRVLAATNHGDADNQLAFALNGESPCGRIQDVAFPEFGTIWLASACTGGLHLLWLASMEAKDRHGPWLLVAGDALSAIGIAGFQAAGATGPRTPQPFRETSGGMLVAEGAVALELRKDCTGDVPSLLAVSASCDAGHATHPDPSGLWLERCIRNALRDASCKPNDILAIVAHGTGTQLNDTAEARAIAAVFSGEDPVVTSLKGTIGHIMSAAGLLNVAVAAEIWRTGRIPPCVGEGPILSGLKLADGETMVAPAGKILALASGFGGNNVAVVVG